MDVNTGIGCDKVLMWGLDELGQVKMLSQV